MWGQSLTNKATFDSIKTSNEKTNRSERAKSKDLSYLAGLSKFFLPYKVELGAATAVLILTAILSLMFTVTYSNFSQSLFS